MRAFAWLCLLALVPSQSFAANFRWTLAYAQGTTEAIIRNGSGASLNIYCPLGQIDTTPGMFVESRKVSAKPGERVAVKIVVDGESHPFELAETSYSARSLDALDKLVRALRTSRKASFVVEYPKHRVAERFSLTGARRSLADILDECRQQ